ncbi:MAG: efflux RND transporter permease subunit, partial [Gemmatimonadota bacterium]
MDLTRAAIEKNRITIMALIAVAIGGVLAFQTLPRARDPGFVVRWAVVTTELPGASPERVEQLLTDPLEKAIQEIPELDHVTSVSKTGYSSITVSIKERYTGMRPIWDDLRRKMERAAGSLPQGTIGPRVNDDLDDVYGIQLALIGEGYTYAELKEVADEVRDQLLHLPDAAKVEINGAQEERVFVEYDDSRLAEMGVSPMYLMEVLRSRNIIVPGGEVRTGAERLVLEPTGNFLSVDDLRRTVVSLPGRRELIYLEDLADVRRGYVDPPGMMMRFDGEPCLGLAVAMRDAGNITVLGQQVRDLVRRLEATYPIGLELREVYMLPDDVDRKIGDFVSSLLQSVAIVMVVMLLTLGLRTGLLVATLIPMAMLMSVMLMPLVGVGLDQVSLAALIIALGMLVDNAIVMSESIMVQIAQGRPPVEAAVNSARELRVPLLIASLTTSAAFLPIYLAESMVGEYTRSLFTVTTLTLLCSWLLALTMIPMLCARFIRVKSGSGEGALDTPFYRRYRRVLLALLRHRRATLAAVAVVFVVAMAGFGLVPAIFFPPTDEALFVVDYEMPVGTPVETTAAVVDEVDGFVRAELAAGPQGGTGVTSW